MTLRRGQRAGKRARRVFWSVFCASILAYLLYHTVQGDRGWFAMLRLQREVGEAEKTLAVLKEESDTIEKRSDLLRPEHIDPDMLDEKARALLNFSRPNEIVIVEPNAAASLHSKLDAKSGQKATSSFQSPNNRNDMMNGRASTSVNDSATPMISKDMIKKKSAAMPGGAHTENATGNSAGGKSADGKSATKNNVSEKSATGKNLSSESLTHKSDGAQNDTLNIEAGN